MLLLCTDLALRNREETVKAYTVSQWANLADRLLQNKLTPKDLFDINEEVFKKQLFMPEDEIKRIELLLSRAGQFGIELSALREKGISVITRSDPEYPIVLKNKLKKQAPPVLFYAGNLSLINNKGVAIVGSREIDEKALSFTKDLSRRCTNDGLNIVSGGARGVDSVAENIAIHEDGITVIFVADSLEKKVKQKETRQAIMRNQTVILSSNRPDMPFQTYTAMERNKFVYALSNYAVVISSEYNKGGTWAGAIEDIKRGWTPLFVRDEEGVPAGNKDLIQNKKSYTITRAILENERKNIYEWFTEQISHKDEEIEPKQLSMQLKI